MTREEQELLERLANPEEAAQEEKENKAELRMLFLRNTLNGMFILMACAAMALIGYSWFRYAPTAKLYGTGIGVAAVLLKMVEATLRMTTMLHKPQGMRHRRRL